MMSTNTMGMGTNTMGMGMGTNTMGMGMGTNTMGMGLMFDAATKNTCATCRFWGGMRKISDDKRKVIAQSMGWCNNPDSPNLGKLTMAGHEMKRPGVCKKWAAL